MNKQKKKIRQTRNAWKDSDVARIVKYHTEDVITDLVI